MTDGTAVLGLGNIGAKAIALAAIKDGVKGASPNAIKIRL